MILGNKDDENATNQENKIPKAVSLAGWIQTDNADQHICTTIWVSAIPRAKIYKFESLLGVSRGLVGLATVCWWLVMACLDVVGVVSARCSGREAHIRECGVATLRALAALMAHASGVAGDVAKTGGFG